MLILHYLCCFTYMHSNKAKQKEKEKNPSNFLSDRQYPRRRFRAKMQKKSVKG